MGEITSTPLASEMTRCDGWINGTGTTAEPSGESSENESNCTEQRSGRDTRGCSVGSLLCAIHSLPVLLLVLSDPVTGLFRRDVLRTGQSIGRTIPRLLCLRLIAGQHGTKARDGRVSQLRRIVSA
jgi:hypothetical protein